VKVTFDFDKRQIAIDGDAPQMVEILQAARELAPLLSQIQINTVASAPTAARQSAERSTGGAATNGSSPVNIGMTMKQWVRQLRLDNNYERVAAIAYYAKMYESRQAFSPKEMSDWFGHCGFTKPAQMAVVVFDAKRRHNFLDTAGHGQYKLTTNGDNLVIGKLNEVEESTEK
jgi:hypothetical protein